MKIKHDNAVISYLNVYHKKAPGMSYWLYAYLLIDSATLPNLVTC
ncbi:hypothetical protein CPS_3956 [Colwellia psychrerythraea 34H]|uniref:Uncharacterized protein n=1 Tax=Colwellia psychrerythraea (strain 34H / ATCC BAA-681) TaxID=167879 RepID=Q47X56_COLP3|nr:hypothetical protein CPS_3956 [Colwellia psychrerythraea 34H]